MKRLLSIASATALALSACADMPKPSNRPLENWESGALIGMGIGAAVGAMAYKKDRTQGAVVGAVGGGLAGGAVGAYMDSQKKDLEKNLAKEIQAGQARVEALPNNVVRIVMTDQTAFETNSAEVKSGFNSTMDKLADVVVRYGKTTLTVVGHTDNVGSSEYNQKLSERRAHAIAQYFESKRVNPTRMALVGKGETQPMTSNATEGGRRANRRVEIYVEPVVQG
jgi:outer membrane protein OmpA-like peptidoglycan-associated protein